MTIQEHNFTARGGALAMMNSRAARILLAGAAGTGKSRAILEKCHAMNLLTSGVKGLFLRKTARSLATSALKTWERDVIPEAVKDGSVKFYGGSAREPAQYRYSNGSSIAIGGLDDPMKVMSTEYDWIYIQEATEATQDDWEMVDSRLRNGVLSFQQLLADCNPDHPNHFLLELARNGKLEHIVSLHEDNPRYFNDDGTPTPEGASYMERLDALTGVRYLRLRKGIWAAAEGVIYEMFDPSMHVIDSFEAPPSWERVWSVDFGYTNPFVWQEWALDSDQRAYLVREIYHTDRLVEDHARQILELTKDSPRPTAIVCDHDAEDRATLERHLGMGTVAAEKAVESGIEIVESRLRLAGDGRPRMFFFRDALVERDGSLVDKRLPTCTVEEIPSYIWAPEPPAQDRKKRQPVKRNDHGCDAKRYFAMEIDLHGQTSVRWG